MQGSVQIAVTVLVLAMGVLVGQGLFLMARSSLPRSPSLPDKSSTTPGSAVQDFHDQFRSIHWRTVGAFLAVFVLVGGWFARDLALTSDWSRLIAPGSFVSSVLLLFVTATAFIAVWSSYISICLWLLGETAADADPVFRYFFYNRDRVAYSSIAAGILDLAVYTTSAIIILAYRPLGFPGEFSWRWSALYYLAVASLGFGASLRIRAKLLVLRGVVSRD